MDKLKSLLFSSCTLEVKHVPANLANRNSKSLHSMRSGETVSLKKIVRHKEKVFGLTFIGDCLPWIQFAELALRIAFDGCNSQTGPLQVG